MATFLGTSGNDSILRASLSAGVDTDPFGLTGTSTGETNLIYGYRGNDLIEAGDGDGSYYGDTIYGGFGRDTIIGGAGYNSLYGDAGDDTIHAGDGGNEIFGGTGADEMHGGSGQDIYNVDNAGDCVIEGGDGGYDYVYSSLASIILAKNVEFLSFLGLSATNISARGNDISNTINTGVGNDTVYGGGGSDGLYGHSGADELHGQAGDDLLEGSHGADTLYGGAGQDYVIGNYGADRLCGGNGNDRFNFYDITDSTPTRRDIIAAAGGAAAFQGAGEAAGDVISLWPIDADATDDTVSAFVFGGTGKGRLSVVDSGTNSIVRGNVDDDGGFEFQIIIADGDVKASAYTAADFVL